jgi:hypothetical protein
MSTSEWENKIEKLSNKKGVKKIAVQNFLGTVGSNPDYMSASMNAEMDAGMYGWNYATQGAIHEGISIFFNQVKSNENEDDENDAVKNLEIMRGIGAKLYSNFGHLSKEEREKKGLWFGDDVGMSDESKANEADCTNCGQSGVDPDPRFQLGSWCEDCQDRLELAKDNWWKNATDEEKRMENEWNDKPWESEFDGESKANEEEKCERCDGEGTLSGQAFDEELNNIGNSGGHPEEIENFAQWRTCPECDGKGYESYSNEELDEEEDEMPLGGSVNAEPKETDTVEQPIIVESVRSQSDFSVRGVSGMTISNTNGVEKYSFDPTQNYETNTVHFSVTEQGGTIFGEEIQMQPKMTTPEELTKEIESHPDVVFTDPDEDMLKKN